MKARLRVLKGKGIKFFFETIILFSWAGITYAQAPCENNQIIPVWNRLQDVQNIYGPNYQSGPKAFLTAGFEPKKMTPNLEIGINWLKGYFQNISGSRYADFSFRYLKGFTPEENLKTNEWYLSTGLVSSYSTRILSPYVLCSEGKMRELDGPSLIDISFNRLNHLAERLVVSVNSIDYPYLINEKPVYKIPKITRSQGRIDYYRYPGSPPENVTNFANWDFLDVYILRNSDKPLFIPFTRKEILEAKVKDLGRIYEERKKLIIEYTQIRPEHEFDQELADRIAEIKKNTAEGAWGYSKENMENRIQLATENNRLAKKEEANKLHSELDVLEEDYNESIRMIQNYLANQPESVLNRPVREYFSVTFGVEMVDRMLEEFDRDLTDRDWGNNSVIVYINPDYFDTKVPLDVPQLITVEFVNLEGAHKHLNEVVDRINQKMDFKALQVLFPNVNMAGAGSPVSQPIQVKTKKPGRYLDKLEELGPDPYPSSQSKANTVTLNFGGTGFNAAPIQVKFPEKPSALGSIANLSDLLLYDSFLDELKSKFLSQLTSEQKGTYDQWIREYDLKTVEDFTQLSMLSWINSNPKASIYLDFEAVKRFPTSGLAANNLAVHLLKSGYPDKSLPILNYWLKEFPDNSLLLGNAATANYYLGEVEKAFQLAKQTVEQDSLHPNANKILAFVHHRKGEKEPAKKASERSLEGSYDEELVALLQEIDPQAPISKIIYNGRKRPYTPQLMDKFRMPGAIQGTDDAEDQSEVILEVLQSIEMTMTAITKTSSEAIIEQAARKNIRQVMTQGGIPIMQMLAQAIYFQSLQTYQEDYSREKERFFKSLNELGNNYSWKVNNITKGYDSEMSKIEGGADWEGERKLAELAKAKCAKLNLALDEYYMETAPLINQLVVRLELMSRDHHSTLSYWAPIWLQSKEAADFPGIQLNYLRDMREILNKYPIELPLDCDRFTIKEEEVVRGTLMVWEDQYCPVKVTAGVGPIKGGINCNTFSLSGGEFLVGEVEVKVNRDWDSIEEVTVGAGVGLTLDVGLKNKATKSGAGFSAELSSKGFVKLTKDPKTLEWNFRNTDAGIKTEATVGADIGRFGVEVKLAETSMGFRSGITSDGMIPKMIDSF